MGFRKSRYIFGVAALLLALWGLFVTFGIGALADPHGDNSERKGGNNGLMYQALGF